MERSTIGYRFRMVGANSHAAKAAGINIERTYIWALAASAAFVGLAGVNQGLSSSGGLTASIHANIGFDAITVALLGGSKARRCIARGSRHRSGRHRSSGRRTTAGSSDFQAA
jgi:simple sugar transport system permease protein